MALPPILRGIARSPGASAAIVLMLALGIGSTCAMFTALDQTVIRPLPYADSGRLAMVWEDFTSYGVPKNRVSPGTFLDWQRRTRTFDALAAYAGPRQMDLSGGGPPEEAMAQSISANLIPLLGVPPLLGRAFSRNDEGPESRVVILSHRLWQRQFGGSPGIVGAKIQMNGLAYTVIGVMPAGFHFPNRTTEMWLPLGLSPDLLSRRNSHFLKVVGRMKSGASLRQVQSEMTSIAQALSREFPATNRNIGITVVELKTELLGETGTAFLALLAAAGCVLLIACANIANLQLGRSAKRQREMAIRSALGASRSRLARQVFAENALLACAGGAMGLAFAQASLRTLQSMIPAGLGTLTLHLDFPILAVAAGLSLLTCILFGSAPALQLIGANLATAAPVTPSGSTFRNILMAAEIAVALVLAIGAALLVETIGHLRAVDPGFRAGQVLTADIATGSVRYHDAANRQAFYSAVLSRVAAIPGVKTVGLTSDLPYTSRGNTMSLKVESQPESSGIGRDALFRLVGGEYLQTIGARLKEGRFLEQRDGRDSIPVVVVNETLARLYWPGRSALGQRIDTGTGVGAPRWMTIVGVIADIRERGLDYALKPAVYVPFTQTEMSFFIPSEIAIRTLADPRAVAKDLQAAVWSVDPQQPVANIRTLENIVDEELESRTQILRLLGGFGMVALLLASLGVYSVLSYLVSLRTREIGLRMAVGATPADIARETVRHAARWTAAGLAVGAAGAAVATRLISTFLFGVSRLDPRIYAFTCGLLVAVAFAAAFLPARRAAAVDPMIALRAD